MLAPLGVAVAVLGLAVAGMAAPAAADPGSASQVVTTVDVRPATARVGDDENGFITFVNKSRADLCTPERIAYEQAFLAWLDGGEQGDPPPEPPSSQQGVKDVQFTQRTAPAATTFAIEGADLPVEVWKLEDDPDGLDCTATDGPGAALFATGAMTWRAITIVTDADVQANQSIEGQVVGTDGQTYRYSVRFLFGEHQGHSVIQLVPTS